MFPEFAINAGPSMTLRDSKQGSQFSVGMLSGSVKLSHFMHIIGRQFITVLFFSTTLSSFVDHIIGIVLRGANEKMIRIDAPLIITMVTNKESGGYGTIFQFITSPMDVIAPLFISQDAVSFVLNGSVPLPTLVLISLCSIKPQRFFKTVKGIQMQWINAEKVLASVYNFKITKAPVSNQVCKTMGHKALSIGFKFASASVLTTSPSPASIWRVLVNSIPEAVLIRLGNHRLYLSHTIQNYTDQLYQVFVPLSTAAIGFEEWLQEDQ